MARTSVDTIKRELRQRTHCDSVTFIQNNSSKVIYKLNFSSPVGIDWVTQKIFSVGSDHDEKLQLWKVYGTESGSFQITVIETAPRFDIDDSQTSFESFN